MAAGLSAPELRVGLVAGARAGEPVVVRIEVCASSEGELLVPRFSEWFECEYTVSGPSGRELRRTDFGNAQYRAPEVGDREPERVGVDGVYASSVALSRIFDMTLAGRYRVQLARDVRDAATGEWVSLRSNVLEFELAE